MQGIVRLSRRLNRVLSTEKDRPSFGAGLPIRFDAIPRAA